MLQPDTTEVSATSHKIIAVDLRFQPGLYEALTELAEARNVNRTDLIREFLADSVRAAWRRRVRARYWPGKGCD